jgi:hypothetical protein
MMKKWIVKLIMGAMIVACVMPIGAFASAETFTDIKGHWAELDIMTAIQLSMVSGYPDGTFRPNEAITRAEAAGMLSRLTKLAPEGASDAFADLDKHWSRDQVRKLIALGFIDPADYPGGFEPNVPATRYEVMKWIASGLAKSEADFAKALVDTQDTLLPTPESFKGGISPEQIPYIAVVKGTGLIEGFPDGTMRPASNTTRAEVVATLLRYEKVEGTNASSYRALNELREVGLTGTNLTSISNYLYGISGDNDRIDDYNHVRNKTMTASNKSFTVQVHRMILVDVTNRKSSGVYDNFFVDSLYFDDGYMVFIEQTMKVNADGVDGLGFANGIGNGLVASMRLDEVYANKQGFETIPESTQRQFFAKGNVKRFWAETSLDKKSGSSRGMITDDGSVMRIKMLE